MSILNVLVTGAAGFLGQHVARALTRRGHQVRALIRSGTEVQVVGQAPWTEIYRADLRTDSVGPAFDGVDGLVHVAARVTGSYSAQMADTVLGSERLLEAMAGSATRTLVLASSLSVYDWTAVDGTLTEESPLERDLYRRDVYAIAKTWQERVVRRLSREHSFDLTVLRCGFVWGPGREYLAALGQRLGRWHLVFGPATRLPLTYVENCADCFAEVVDNRRAAGETFNVVDGHDATAWRYLGEYLRRTGSSVRRVPVPYGVALAGARLADWINERCWRGRARLPGLLIPRRFQSRFKPVRVSAHKLRDVLEWRPPFDLAQSLQRTYEALEPHTALPNRRVEVHNV
ncbi:MAG TPA: NAD(P)-dependent oxidoreductase [Candidatus Methylomirabilis sp.]|nr:NAD(P)-dependent oxidoreductase [Candidatus Methylomirabilis sp.]